MPRLTIVHAAEDVACPKCAHAFGVSAGISRQAIDRRLTHHGKPLEADLAPTPDAAPCTRLPSEHSVGKHDWVNAG
jgi:hypothetical protein